MNKSSSSVLIVSSPSMKRNSSIAYSHLLANHVASARAILSPHFFHFFFPSIARFRGIEPRDLEMRGGIVDSIEICERRCEGGEQRHSSSRPEWSLAVCQGTLQSSLGAILPPYAERRIELEALGEVCPRSSEHRGRGRKVVLHDGMKPGGGFPSKRKNQGLANTIAAIRNQKRETNTGNFPHDA